MTFLRNIAKREDGVAVIVAMGTMTVLLILGAVALSTSVHVGASTNTETLKKRAFETAEAGLQSTQYRLNMLGPSSDKCIGGATSAVVAPTSGGTCAGYTETMGNGANFTSYTTTPLASGGNCAGTQVVSTTGAIDQRCITATGTVGGVTRRVQARVASYSDVPVFPVAGLLSATNIDIGGSAGVSGSVGLNGLLSITGSASTDITVVFGPNGSFSSGTSHPPASTRSPDDGPFVLPPVDPGTSATTNDNGRLSNGMDPVGSNTWDPTTRSLSVKSGTVTLGGGLYNFCNLTLQSKAILRVMNPARTQIFIDSPTRQGSGCPAGSGNFNMGGQSTLAQAGTDPTAFQLFIVGNGTAINFNGGQSFYGTVYAPTTQIVLNGGAVVQGAIAAYSIRSTGNVTIHGDERARDIRMNAAGVFFRTAWRECTPVPSSASDPGSGC